MSGPPSPRNVRLLSVESHSMVVAWRPPVPSHGVITNYEIKRNVLVGDKPRVIIVDNDTLQYRISGLAINTSYVVQVRAILAYTITRSLSGVLLECLLHVFLYLGVVS